MVLKLMATPTNWSTVKIVMLLKYDIINKDEIRTKLDLIKQELKQKAYYGKMEKLFAKGKLEDGEQRKKFMSQMKLEIRMMYVMKDHANMEDLFNAALDL
jgi:hypothetical protein